MIGTGIDVRVRIQDIVASQLPEFILSDAPLTDDFLRQFYVSQEFQGGAMDFASNLDQYLDVTILTKEAKFELTQPVSETDTEIFVNSTDTFPKEWGLLKINDEIITYTGITTNSFTGAVRGFSGITSYHTPDTPNDLVFETTEASSHLSEASVQNLSTLFLKEFYTKIKYTFTPGFENLDTSANLNKGNWIRQARSFYQTKGSEESIIILFKVLFDQTPRVVDLEDLMIKPSTANYIKYDYAVCLPVKGDPKKLEGRSVFQSNDPNITASITRVENLVRDGQNYIRVNYFVGKDEESDEKKLFKLSARTKVQKPWLSQDPTITVDSTIGFPEKGTIFASNGISISYDDKTVNQFLGVSSENIEDTLTFGDELFEDIFIVGTSVDGEEIQIRSTGVISDVTFMEEPKGIDPGETIEPISVGENITNTTFSNEDLDYTQIIANSFIYNTSVRMEVKEFSGSSFQIDSRYLDKSFIDIGDKVDILGRGSQEIILADRLVSGVEFSTAVITIDDSSGIQSGDLIDIRRKQKYATSSGIDIDYGDESLLSNVLNVYDATEYNRHLYVATNSLPSYDIDTTAIENIINNINDDNFDFEDSLPADNTYSAVKLDTDTEFLTGDFIVYHLDDDAEAICAPGVYVVEVLDVKKIRLYRSQSLIGGPSFVSLTSNDVPGNHIFTLSVQSARKISPENALIKIPVPQDTNVFNAARAPYTISDESKVALLTNGVNVTTYKSSDKSYYGPLRDISAVFGGSGYNVIDPPEIVIADSLSGPAATAYPAMKGKLEDILVDPQDFDVSRITSVSITGGNSDGADVEPVFVERFRSLAFDSRLIEDGGNIADFPNTISFQQPHNLDGGESISYNSFGKKEVGISATETLTNGVAYFASIVNNRSIKLHGSESDALAGINEINLDGVNLGEGIQAFETKTSKQLTSIKIVDDGGFFYNREIFLDNTKVDVGSDCFNYKAHGFLTGETIVYSVTGGDAVEPLVDGKEYLVGALDEDRIRLYEIGSVDNRDENIVKENYIQFIDGLGGASSVHRVAYPKIEVSISAEFISGVDREFTLTPIIRGEIERVYLTSGGLYGDTLLNFNKEPQYKILSGTAAKAAPVISGGVILGSSILNLGKDYSPDPVVKLIDPTGRGTAAILRAIVTEGRVVQIKILDTGLNYSDESYIEIKDSIDDAILRPSIRALTVNRSYRFGFDSIVDGKYSVINYGEKLQADVYREDPIIHSPLIGWAMDGNPIYGPYGYSDPASSNSEIVPLKSSYYLDTSSVSNRPAVTQYPAGFFVDDYVYSEDFGDLDSYNGRYTKTPEFPNGVYAYFATITNVNSDPVGQPAFPYYIGDSFRDSPIFSEERRTEEVFHNKPIFRNTFPYAVANRGMGSEYLVQPYLSESQGIIVDSITNGSIDSAKVVSGGEGYRVGEFARFDDADDILNVDISAVGGKDVVSSTSVISDYPAGDVVATRDAKEQVKLYISPYHEVLENQLVILENVPEELRGLNRSSLRAVEVDDSSVVINQDLSIGLDGEIIDIKIIRFIGNFLPGDIFFVGTDEFRLLELFPIQNVIRVVRVGNTQAAYIIGQKLQKRSRWLTVDDTESDVNSELDYVRHLNPTYTFGFGLETGIATSSNYTVSDTTKVVSIQSQNIYVPNHGFRQNERVTFNRDASTNQINALDVDGNSFSVPVALSSDYYIEVISGNFIGIKTSIESEPLLFVKPTNTGTIDSDLYYFETNRQQQSLDVKKVAVIIETDSDHDLQTGDIVRTSMTDGLDRVLNINVSPNNELLAINPTTFRPSDVDTTSNTLTLSNHTYKTGDLVQYDSDTSNIDGLNRWNVYFVIKIDKSTIQLATSLEDTKPGNEVPISFESTGGNDQKISLINPNIDLNDNSLVLDLSDPSLAGWDVVFYHDSNLTDIFLNNGIDSEFVVVAEGTPGQLGAKKTLSYSSNNKETIFYALYDKVNSKLGNIDDRAVRHNRIDYIDSEYVGRFDVFVTDSTTFEYVLFDTPIFPATNVSYQTESKTATGPVADVRILSSGSNFKKVPEFSSFFSETGFNGVLKVDSSDIGRIESTDIRYPGWGYLSDSTLAPRCSIQRKIGYNTADFIESIEVVYGGLGYQSAPEAVLVNSDTGKEVSNGFISLDVLNTTIAAANVIVPPTGLSSVDHFLYTVNNTNGIPVSSIGAVNKVSNVVEFVVQTPIAGYSRPPFQVGDSVFIENVRTVDDIPGNFNSREIGFAFPTITGVLNTNPVRVFVQYPINVELGDVVDNQRLFASLINSKIYPTFEVVQKTARLSAGERLSIVINGDVQETDLIVKFSDESSFKVSGIYYLVVGDVLKGSISGVEVTVDSIDSTKGTFVTKTSSRIEGGWEDNIGFMNDDMQSVSDNDYYQKLSYSIKSTISYDDLIGPVNKLVHPKGLKNFSDTKIETSGSISVGGTSSESITIDLIGLTDGTNKPLRVDRINAYDLGYDLDIVNNKTSKIKIEALTNRKRLSDYVLLKSNRVLMMDDIAPLFRNFRFVPLDESALTLKTLDEANNNFVRGVIQTRNPFTDEVQLEEFVSLIKGGDTYNQTKSIITTEVDGDGYGRTGTFPKSGALNTYEVKYVPSVEYFETFDAGLKLLLTQSNNNSLPDLDLSSVKLASEKVTINPGDSQTIFTTQDSSSGAVIYSTVSGENGSLEYVECYGFTYGGDTYDNVYGFDATNSSNFEQIVSGPYSTTSVSGDRMSFIYTNNTAGVVTVSSKITGFGTSTGPDVYRFKSDDIPDGSERSINLISGLQTTTSSNVSIDMISLDAALFQSVRTIVYIKGNGYSSINQVMSSNHSGETSLSSTEYLFNSDGLSTGIGTFDSEISGGNFIIKYFPDDNLPAGDLELFTYQEAFYRDNDFLNYNISQVLDYGATEESYYIDNYLLPFNRFDFPVTYKNIPILEKAFNPSVVIENSVFKIADHFFSPGEEVIYEAGDSASQPFSPIQVSGLGDLPETVYVVVINKDSFQLAQTQQDALNGNFLTVTSNGTGNRHTIGMAKKLEKSIITLDGVLQSPIASRNLTYTTDIVVDDTSEYIVLTGIGTIVGGDIFKIDDEFVLIKTVGFATVSDGPIDNNGNVPLIEVSRGVLGSDATSHSNGSSAELYSGSYNLENSNVYFTEAPRELPLDSLTESNLKGENSDFQGRIFLQKEYDKNVVYDDISTEFDGLTDTFNITSIGSTIPEIPDGSGLVLINDIYQSPTTENNKDNEFEFDYDPTPGSTSIIFTGITSSNGDRIVSTLDVNQNQLPRGGRIVSIASTPGLGYAPLSGAILEATASGGAINNITGTFGSGYNSVVSIAVTETGHTGNPAIIEGVPGPGGELSINIIDGGSGYLNPEVSAPDPNYFRLPVIGVFRRDGTTDMGSNLFVTPTVSASRTTDPARADYFSIYEFDISESTYGFQEGDVLRVVGLVTDKSLSAPIEEFELTISEISKDNFSAFNFGQLDFIDSIADEQNGETIRFPLFYKGNLVSFEKDPSLPDSSLLDLNAILLVFINTVLQVPGESYELFGGTSIRFTEAPTEDDIVDIYFYRGKAGIDDELIQISGTTLKPGDDVQLTKNNDIAGTKTQDIRIVDQIEKSDEFSTNLYAGRGDLTEDNPRPLAWDKQKRDVFIYTEPVTKVRENYESVITPTASIISGFTTTSTTLLVDNVDLFEYEETYSDINFDIRVNNGYVPAELEVNLTNDVVTGVTVLNPSDNFGYQADDQISFTISPTGEKALGRILVTAGRMTGAVIDDGGSGYETAPFYVIQNTQNSVENKSNALTFNGFSGTITQIESISGGSTGKRIRFSYETEGDISLLQSNYRVSIFNTVVGDGVRSVDTNDTQTIGIGTQFLDCVYRVILPTQTGPDSGTFTVNVGSEVDVSSINLSGSKIGQFSWGIVEGITRTEGVTVSAQTDGSTYDVNMSAYPVLLRSSRGFNDEGGISDTL